MGCGILGAGEKGADVWEEGLRPPWSWWNRFRAVLASCFWLLCIFGGPVSASTGQGRCTHQTYFEDTDHALDVYRICGEEAGKTLMIIGGIQGDEPAGFLAADHYVDLTLKRGNLIVVPRANLPSIVESKRQIRRDMNRCFGTAGPGGDYEGKVVEVLKDLMGESDLLLNLHEGSGFYAPRWISKERNPLRYGQSLIADAAQYGRRDGHILDLGAMADFVVKKMNAQIPEAGHHFHFNNHRTLEEDSLHKEQRNSATFYALTQREIPAFGVETSKSLPLKMKVQHHIHAINGFMEFLDIVPEIPALRIPPPVLDYLVVSVEGYPPFVVKKNERLEVPQGSVLRVSQVVANYPRGLSVRMDGVDGVNILGRSVTLRENVRVRVFKDHEPCGSVAIVLRDFSHKPGFRTEQPQGEGLSYQVRIDATVFWIPDGAMVDVPLGAIFEILAVESGQTDPMDLVVNFKGFVPNTSYNTGEDRGYPIDTAKDLWIRYSEGGKGLVYPVETSLKGKRIGGFKVRLQPQSGGDARPGSL
ncbi:M14/M99 family metallopeptidase [Desulfobotulus sp.]|uniref:M14/M99 family metallopeptidase n=1 Tax=Desulfobotulus sp. TaxID=1940337 RepID=UPI002A36F954|nr:M14/M99 family metallopeptidase [Desulfobotulus sp.]MDY0163739.1 M14/M99 family metallopeptidase [Desulfobotulus sp.]